MEATFSRSEGGVEFLCSSIGYFFSALFFSAPVDNLELREPKLRLMFKFLRNNTRTNTGIDTVYYTSSFFWDRKVFVLNLELDRMFYIQQMYPLHLYFYNLFAMPNVPTSLCYIRLFQIGKYVPI